MPMKRNFSIQIRLLESETFDTPLVHEASF